MSDAAAEPTEELTWFDWIESQPTREEWLRARLADVRALIDLTDIVLPPLAVSCGWTGSGMEGWTLGSCYDASASAGGIVEIFVSPTLTDSVEVVSVMLHEIVHAIVGSKAGHGPAYAEVAKKLQLTKAGRDGKGTWPEQAWPSDALTTRLKRWSEGKRGDADTNDGNDIIYVPWDVYPHAQLTAPPPQTSAVPSPSKQGTRMLKASCTVCGYTIRITMKWASRGLPTCVCGSGFHLAKDNAPTE